MTIYESISTMIAFAVLVVAILSIKKTKAALEMALSGGFDITAPIPKGPCYCANRFGVRSTGTIYIYLFSSLIIPQYLSCENTSLT